MTLIKFQGIGIKALCATVPKNVVKTISRTDLLDEDQLIKFIESTGVIERRIADKDTCGSDLAFNAAMNLLDKASIQKDDIGALIFLSQTPDYRVPQSSIILQDRLNLPKTTLAFDVSMTCSGFIYGLFIAYSLANIEGINNVLFLIGETISKITSTKDKSSGLLLGDGGSAALISKDCKYGESFFSLNTDGSNYKSVIIPGGGFRNMSSIETLKDKVYEDGSIRNDEQVNMDGMDVFSFAVSEMPKDIKRLLNFSGTDISLIDKFVFHQANKYMIDFIAKKLKVDPQKIIYSIQKYGNTSGVSIPLTIVDQKALINNNDLILLNAIGAGFSWGSILLEIKDCEIFEISEF